MHIFFQVRHTYVTKGTYAYIHTYSKGEPRVPVHTIYSRTYISYCALVYSAWYQLAPACNSSYGWNFSLVIRVHITKLHELKTALDASRGKWRCKQGASTDSSGPKSMVIRWRSRDKPQRTPTNTQTHQHTREVRFFSKTKARCGQTFWEFSHRHLHTGDR